MEEQKKIVLRVNEFYRMLKDIFEFGGGAYTAYQELNEEADNIYHKRYQVNNITALNEYDRDMAKQSIGLYRDSFKSLGNDMPEEFIIPMALFQIHINDINMVLTKARYKARHKMISEFKLPIELDTERARKCFAKAIEAQYIKVLDNGLQWVFGDSKGQARLGYFCNKVFETPRPINKLEEIFKVKKLSSSISNADIEAKRADVKKWRNEITDTIFND